MKKHRELTNSELQSITGGGAWYEIGKVVGRYADRLADVFNRMNRS